MGRDPDAEKKQRETDVVIVEGDEGIKVPQHKLDFVCEQVRFLFKDPSRNVFFLYSTSTGG